MSYWAVESAQGAILWPFPRAKATVLEWATERLDRVREQDFNRLSKRIFWDQLVRWAAEQMDWVGEQDSVWLFRRDKNSLCWFYRVTALVRLNFFVSNREQLCFIYRTSWQEGGRKLSNIREILLIWKIGVIWLYSRYWLLLLLD